MKKILVCEDEAAIRDFVVINLRRAGYDVVEADCGEMALEKYEEHNGDFDVAILDIMMPGMDGIQALKHVRNDEGSLCSDVPVIALTANAVVGAKELYFDAGFDNFLSKPVDPKKLEMMLVNSLNPSLVASFEAVDEGDNISEGHTELPIINGIDWRYARLNFENDSSMLDTIKMFRNSVAKDVEEINGYFGRIDEEDAVNSYRIKVHGMKSTASLIGIVRLAGMAMELEEAARDMNRDVIMLLHPVFIAAWKEYYNELAVLFNDDEPLKDADEFHNEILEIFESIRQAAKQMDVDTLDEMSQRLDKYSFEGKAAENIDQVKKSIFNFEVEKLRECYYT